MSGVQSFVIKNNSQPPLLVSATGVPPIVLYYNSSSGNITSAGNFTVTVMATGGVVFNVDFSAGPGGPLDIIPGPNPGDAQVDINYV